MTGIETGADNTLNFNIHLQMQGLKGEDIVDDTVWIVKTHSPWIMPQQPLFYCNRTICIIRSPIDVIISFLHLFTVCNHSQKAQFEYHENYPVFWEWWVKMFTQRMAAWYRQLMFDAKMKKLPILFVRFEDLVLNPEPELTNIMKFLLNVTDITGTNAERRVKEVIAKGKDATVLYKLKDNTRQFFSNHGRYTKEQMAYIEHEMKDIMYYFGYAKIKEDPDNITGFHEYKVTDQELYKHYNEYKMLNRHSLEWNEYMKDEERATIWFQNCDPEKVVDLLTWAEGDQISAPLRHDMEIRMFGKSSLDCK